MSRIADLADALHYLADALRQLDIIVSLPTCNKCDKLGGCEYAPEWGDSVRYNCPFFEPRKDKEK